MQVHTSDKQLKTMHILVSSNSYICKSNACSIVPIKRFKESINLTKDKTYPTKFKGSNVTVINHKRQWINKLKSKDEMYLSNKIP